MHAKPRPILGATLGLLLGLVTVGLLWQLGVLPPDRLVLFGVCALMIVIVTGILTQRAGLVRARFTIIMVLAGALLGVGLTGIPEAISPGQISEGCSLKVASSLGTASPASTTAVDPFSVTPDDTVEWQAATGEPLTAWDAEMGLRIGGFDVPRWHNDVPNADGRTEFAASGDVGPFLADLGVELRGTTHVYGVADAEEGACAVDGFVRIEGDGAFETPLLVTLWVALWIVLLAIVIVATAVARSISLAERATAPGAPTVGTGGNAETRVADDPQRTATGSPGRVTEARRRAASNGSSSNGGSSGSGRGAERGAAAVPAEAGASGGDEVAETVAFEPVEEQGLDGTEDADGADGGETAGSADDAPGDDSTRE